MPQRSPTGFPSNQRHEQANTLAKTNRWSTKVLPRGESRFERSPSVLYLFLLTRQTQGSTSSAKLPGMVWFIFDCFLTQFTPVLYFSRSLIFYINWEFDLMVQTLGWGYYLNQNDNSKISSVIAIKSSHNYINLWSGDRLKIEISRKVVMNYELISSWERAISCSGLTMS